MVLGFWNKKTLSASLGLGAGLALVLGLVACQPKDDDKEEEQTPAQKPFGEVTPTEGQSYSYSFSTQDEQAKIGSYDYSGVLYKTETKCNTGVLNYNSRSQFCNLLIDENLNKRCAYEVRIKTFESDCRPYVKTEEPPGSDKDKNKDADKRAKKKSKIEEFGTNKLVQCRVDQIKIKNRERNSARLTGTRGFQTSKNLATKSFLWKPELAGAIHETIYGNPRKAGLSIRVTLAPPTADRGASILILAEKRAEATAKDAKKLAPAEKRIYVLGPTDGPAILAFNDKEVLDEKEEFEELFVRCDVGGALNRTPLTPENFVCAGKSNIGDKKEDVALSKLGVWTEDPQNFALNVDGTESSEDLVPSDDSRKRDSIIVRLLDKKTAKQAIPGILNDTAMAVINVPTLSADQDIQATFISGLGFSPGKVKIEDNVRKFHLEFSCNLTGTSK